MITYIDEDLVARIRELGGVSAIAISHPHFYGSMIEWAHAFGAPVYIHAADRQWVARTDDCVRFWDGDTLQIGAGLTLVNAGVHFDGGQVLHRATGGDDAGALFSGDIFNVVQDRRWVSFMHSYPNLIPERRTIRRTLALIEPLPFDRVYGAWWQRIVHSDGAAAVRRSAERYLRWALDDLMPVGSCTGAGAGAGRGRAEDRACSPAAGGVSAAAGGARCGRGRARCGRGRARCGRAVTPVPRTPPAPWAAHLSGARGRAGPGP